MNTQKYHSITYREEEMTALITINRPDCYNALNKESKSELCYALQEANQSSRVRTIILTGNGKAFSSGQDLSDRTVSGNQGPVDLGKTLTEEWNPLIRSLRTSDKLVIGAINGVCAGAGLSLALSCDYIIARPQTKFVSGFSQIGLVLDAGSSFRLVRSLGYQRTLEFSLMGEPLFAEDFLQLGVINAINLDPLQAAGVVASKINKMAPLAVKALKKNLLYALDHSYQESMERETHTQKMLGQTNDYQEGVRAFFDKRSPQFQGS